MTEAMPDTVSYTLNNSPLNTKEPVLHADRSVTPLLVVVSIDTEEDDWTPSREDIRVTNIRALPRLHRIFEEFGVRPTYFTSYQVARVAWAGEILRSLGADGTTEIAAHLHPWNTPPLREPFLPPNTMMKNLPEELQVEKLTVLTDALASAIGVRPRSFRAGRYGIGRTGAALLARCGYAVDSSVTPFLDWRRYDGGPDFREAPIGVYYPSLSDIAVPASAGPIVELPLSIGYTRRPFARWSRWHERLMASRVGTLSLGSLAYRTRFVRKVQLSFETDTVSDMLILTRHLVLGGARFIHLTWHSPTMVAGLSPFATRPTDRDRFRANIDEYFDRLSSLLAFSFATVAEAAERLAEAPLMESSHVGSR